MQELVIAELKGLSEAPLRVPMTTSCPQECGCLHACLPCGQAISYRRGCGGCQAGQGFWSRNTDDQQLPSVCVFSVFDYIP